MSPRVPVIGHIVHCDRTTPHLWELATLEALSRQTIAAGAVPVVVTDVDIEPGDGVIQALRRGVVDALVTTAFCARTAWVNDLAHSGMPIVWIGPSPGRDGPFVTLDGRAAMETLVLHLAQQGRRRIGLITVRNPPGDVAARIDGWRHGLAKARLLQDDDLVIEGDFTPESGAACALELWARRPDAIIAVTDPMARGAMAALEAHGIRVPDDVAIAGIDGAGRLDRRLTTVCQPFDLIAEAVVAEVLVQLGGGRANPETFLLGDLLVGSSTVAAADSAG